MMKVASYGNIVFLRKCRNGPILSDGLIGGDMSSLLSCPVTKTVRQPQVNLQNFLTLRRIAGFSLFSCRGLGLSVSWRTPTNSWEEPYATNSILIT